MLPCAEFGLQSDIATHHDAARYNKLDRCNDLTNVFYRNNPGTRA